MLCKRFFIGLDKTLRFAADSSTFHLIIALKSAHGRGQSILNNIRLIDMSCEIKEHLAPLLCDDDQQFYNFKRAEPIQQVCCKGR